ncbi:LCP family protein [Trueperella sp. LYQ143]|uniref:LCP family protein n=1 Tax=unclassified Trueperella TaxID=2630174 RepID=UPI003983985A
MTKNAASARSHRAVRHGHAARRPRRFLRIFLLCVLAVTLSVGTAVGMLYHGLQSSITEHQVESYLTSSERPTVAAPSDQQAGKPLNILLLGSDVREGAADIDGAGAAGEVSGMRSDTAMIMHISANRSRVDIVSIPRDTLVDIPSCTLPNGKVTSPQYDTMFNAAFAIGGQSDDVGAAAACTIRTVEKLTNVFIDGFIVVNFATFKQVVNTLGGVDMCFSEDLHDDAAGLDLSKGCHTLNGDQALAIARARKEIGNGSDLQRITRQHQLLEAIAKKVFDMNLASDLPSLYRVLHNVTENLDTSDGMGDITFLGGLLYSLRGLKIDDLNFITMPYGPAADGNRVAPTPEAEKVWQALAQDKPLPETTDINGQSPIINGTEAELNEFTQSIGSTLKEPR